MNEQATPLPRTLRDRLRQGRFVMTAELARRCHATRRTCCARRRAQGLRRRGQRHRRRRRPRPYERAGGRRILIGAGIEPILQITCRDKNRIALQSEMMGAAALGIRNLLLLTGDDPKAGDQPDTKPVFDIDSKTLIETARRLRDDGTLPTGRKVAGKPRSSSAPPTCRSIRPPAGSRTGAPRQGQIRRAVRADPVLHGCGHRAPLCRRARTGRRDPRARILIGVNPLRSAKSARWMKSHLYGTIIPDAMIDAHGEAPPTRRARACASASN
jgi:methylenetetrahydrofolate reductase (NADPH)